MKEEEMDGNCFKPETYDEEEGVEAKSKRTTWKKGFLL